MNGQRPSRLPEIRNFALLPVCSNAQLRGETVPELSGCGQSKRRSLHATLRPETSAHHPSDVLSHALNSLRAAQKVMRFDSGGGKAPVRTVGEKAMVRSIPSDLSQTPRYRDLAPEREPYSTQRAMRSPCCGGTRENLLCSTRASLNFASTPLLTAGALPAGTIVLRRIGHADTDAFYAVERFETMSNRIAGERTGQIVHKRACDLAPFHTTPNGN